MQDTKNIGLRGVTVADTRISLVDGAQGQLLYRGYDIRSLARDATYEEVTFLLLMGRLPSAAELQATRERLAYSRGVPTGLLSYLRTRSPHAQPMDVLQGAIPVLADYDPHLGASDRGRLVRSSLRLIGATAMAVAAWHHVRRGHDLFPLDADLSHAGAFLQALQGRRPSPDEERLVDTLLILHAEHAFNASTFAAREVASTQAHLHASVCSAVGALSGALHGGANARVMQMLLDIGAPENVDAWLEQRLAAGQRVMGLGHAVYKTEDPRAAILREVAERALAGRPEEAYFRLALRVEERARQLLRERKGLDLFPNVDFYSSPILYALGLTPDEFPAFFAVARVVGWCAHVIEERLAEAQPRAALYRPDAHYVGRHCGPQGCRFVPIDARGAGCPCGREFDGCTEDEALRDLQ